MDSTVAVGSDQNNTSGMTSNKNLVPKAGETISAIIKPWGNIVKLNQESDAALFLVEGDALVTLEVKTIKVAKLNLEDPVYPEEVPVEETNTDIPVVE